jgi:23S rRNA pseudouridine1911/1915/1917 synthase
VSSAPAELVATPGRLDAVIAALTGAPRADVQRAIAAGGVLVDGRARPKSHRLRGGERLTLDLAARSPEAAPGGPVPVRFRDEHLLVVAKPAGVVTHPTASHGGDTLVDRLAAMDVPLAPAGGPLRPGIVHRLDAGTSGLLVVASTDEAYGRLQDMFRGHEVVRRYLALVRGAPAQDVFTVEAPLGRRAARIVVDRAEGRAAATGFEVRERFARTSLLEAAPRTGRTHQIRVHLQAAGFPIIGDRRYGGGGDEARLLGLDRPFLHAWRLAFTHPITGDRIDLTEPPSEDLAAALANARADLRP